MTHNMLKTSGNTEYYTPPKIIEAARRAMYWIQLDPASSEVANKIVGAETIYTKDDDGLSLDWFGTVWMNHHFGRSQNAAWVNKLIAAYTNGNVNEACCITYACTSEKWFQPLMEFPQCFLFPRTNYLLPDGSVKRGAQKGSVVTYLGDNNNVFISEFSGLGRVKVLA